MRFPRWTSALAVAVLAAACSTGSGGKVTPPSPTPVEAILSQALSLQEQGNLDAAKAAFKEVLRRTPDNAIAHYDLGVIAQQQKENPAALQEYAAALAITPTYVPALFNTATIYGSTDPALAITTYRKITKLQPMAPTAYLNLGLLELEAGQQKQGFADLETALRQDPGLINGLSPSVTAELRKSRGSAPSPSATP